MHRRIERKHHVFLVVAYRSLSEAARKQGGRGCNAGEICARRLFFSGCIRKSTGVVHAVCMQPVTVETYLAFNKQAFLNDNQPCPHFLLKFSFRQRMLQLEFRNFENPNTNQKNHTEKSHRDTPEVGSDNRDVWILTMLTETSAQLCRSTVAYFSSKALSQTSNAPT